MDGRPPHAQNMDVLYAAHSTCVIYSLRLPNDNAPVRCPFFCYFSLDTQRKGNVTLHPIVTIKFLPTEVNDRDCNDNRLTLSPFVKRTKGDCHLFLGDEKFFQKALDNCYHVCYTSPKLSLKLS